MTESVSTVVLIDDDVSFTHRLSRLLRSDGHSVAVASTGAAGIELLRAASRPGAIVLEPNLAGAAWYQLLRLAAQRVGSSRLLVITAFWSVALAQEAQTSGAEVCLRKPISDSEMRSLVRRAPADRAFQAPRAGDPPSLAGVEWEYVNQVIRDCRGNMSQAARLLGIHRPSLYKKLRKHPPIR